MSHRRSYWKSTLLSCVIAILVFAALALLLGGFSQSNHAGLMIGILAPIGAVSLLVALGGFVCLWRDANATSGRPDILLDFAFRPAATRRGTSSLLRAILPAARIRPGDVVQVRSLDEIRNTLDAAGTLDGLPFMSEMERFCGRTFCVHRRVDHINDMRNKTGLRRIRNVVTLANVRCSGEQHGGCEAECQILWKEAWLEGEPAGQPEAIAAAAPASLAEPAGEPAMQFEAADRTYFCQMTALWEASTPLAFLDPRPDLRVMLSGNVGFATFALTILSRVFNAAQALRGGSGFPPIPASPTAGRSPSSDLQLRSGDAVTVRSLDEIAATLVDGRNRGLWFDRDMVRFCGHAAIVRRPVRRVIHERTGKMVVMKTPCLVLENIAATGEFLRLCPQHEYIFWRAIWLKPQDASETGVGAASVNKE